jgi:predicted DCC family thiol-disulfide oxidoreductase YuxK
MFRRAGGALGAGIRRRRGPAGGRSLATGGGESQRPGLRHADRVDAAGSDFADEIGNTRLAQTVFHGQKREWEKGRFTVLFDGGCPLCTKEIAHYQRLNAKAAPPFGEVVFLNLVGGEVVVEDLLEQMQVTKDDAMRRMHVVTEDAKIVTSADAFREMWARLPYWRGIVPFCAIPGVMPAANWAYNKFAERRYAFRRNAAETAPCHIKGARK